MKARRFRRLKRKVEKFHEYTVIQSYYPFGDFAGRYGFEPDNFDIKAKDPLMAIQRYAKKYRRIHKKWPHGYYPTKHITMTYHNFAYWAVKDEKDYVDYYG